MGKKQSGSHEIGHLGETSPISGQGQHVPFQTLQFTQM